MNKNLIYIIGVVVAVGIFAAIFIFGGGRSLQTAAMGDDLTLGIYAINGTPTGGGYVSLPFVAERKDDLFLNVTVDFDKNGSFSQNEWIAQNMRARVYEDYRNNFLFSTEGIEFAQGQTFSVAVTLTQFALSGHEGISMQTDGEFKEFSASVELQEMSDMLGINVPGASEELKRGPTSVFASSHSEPPGAAQGQEEDVNVFRGPPVPDLAQGPMECSAVSAANNLISLAGENGALDQVPQNTRDLIEELKSDMQFGAGGQQGILNSNFLAGKNAFVARHNLPIVTTRKTAPTFQDIVDALESGGAVELSMRFLRSASGHANTGHTITVVGAFTQGGKQFVQVHDPATRPPGVENLELNFKAQAGNTELQGIQYPMWDGIAIIDDIFVQNWTEPQHATTGEAVGQEEETSRIEVLVLGNGLYPKNQFFVETGSECDQAPHYHANGTVYGLRNETSIQMVSANDPGGCGFGKVAEVPVRQIDITFEQSQELIKNIP